MEQPIESGINIDWMVVREIVFTDFVDGEAPGPVRDLPIDIDVEPTIREDGKACRIAITLTVNETDDSGALRARLLVKTEAQFSTSGEASVGIRTFAVRQGPVIMVPFVREHLANISGRTRLGQVLINPLHMREAIAAKP